MASSRKKTQKEAVERTVSRAERRPAPASPDSIIIRGARVHNLKNVSLELPRNRLIVLTGVSGSGKSSLAFNTIYAEGQRRFVESLSSYARQFLERMDKPDVDFIQGISPAIAIEQKTAARNPRSTVGTSTELYDYLRLLFARIGRTYCLNCGTLVQRDTVQSVIDSLKERLGKKKELKIYVLFPLHQHKDISLPVELDHLKKEGFFRVLHGDQIIDLHEQSLPAKTKAEKVRVLVDRLILREGEEETRIADSIETAFRAGDGHVIIRFLDDGGEITANQHFACSKCGTKHEEPDPRLFSFNNPFGACPKCQGFGRSVGIDMNLVVPDRLKSLREGAIAPWTAPKWHNWLRDLLRIAYDAKLRIDVPFEQLTDAALAIVMNGSGSYKGVNGFFRMIEGKLYKIYYRIFLSRYRGYTTCDACGGARLRPEALCVKVGGKNMHDLVRMTIREVDAFFEELTLSRFDQEVGRRILAELRRRLRYLVDVGIGYLTLDRLSNTLSGGETQRINLATALGSSLVGSLYVLDEPSIGLHPRDNAKLIAILKSLRDVGNTVLVVEHDADMMRAADQIVDMGPRAGEAGGTVVVQGDIEKVRSHDSSLTGGYLSGRLSIPVPAKRRKRSKQAIVVRGAAEHNLKSIDVEIPLGLLVAVTGVSGSGKSTFVHDVLYGGLRFEKGEPADRVGMFRAIEGADRIDGVELVDQTPIGRTPRSNPITYIKAFDLIRDLFASTQAAKMHGYTPGYFSFNVEGGRCETCEGSGIQTVEMQFLADLELICEVCKGKRYKKEVLEVRYRGKNVDEILAMTVDEAVVFFSAHAGGKGVAKKLAVLQDVGMGYVRLGQSATTLSGGEAQRVKLAAHLAARDQERKLLFILDEPTTGLHFDDIAKLLRALNALVESGNSVLIIEHNMDVVKCADWVIDLGPDAGAEGGEVVAAGTPEEVARAKASVTGKFLKQYLAK